ncbi:hypothetical protein [Nocardia wallacei]|uniref:hypothetical protein n=1 Tax=Nocardia wallacei TaxID=480035 RepID=UPI0024576B5F|nr:hypothetical protein [Nocardia wallacei]
MTASSPQQFRRTWTPRSTATRTIPSTVWAAGIEPLDPGDRWPIPILSRAVTEFSAPASRVLLIGWPAAARRGPLQVIPAGTGGALAAVEALDRRPRIEPTAGEGPQDSHATAPLVLVSLLADHEDGLQPGPVADLAAPRVAEGGLLVVLSRCRHSRTGVLDDPAVAVVAAAQAADLLYLQHIIATPLHGDTITTATPPVPTGLARHAVAHTDVLVFLRPASAPAPQQ